MPKSSFIYLFYVPSLDKVTVARVEEPNDGRYSILSQEELDILPPIYRNAVIKLSKLLFKTNEIKVQRELFESFTNKFTTHVKILRKWKELEGRNIYPRSLLEEIESYINVIATQHLYDETFFNFSFSKTDEFPVLNKVLTHFIFDEKFKSDVDEFIHMNRNIKESLTFPHYQLNEFWKFYLLHSLSPITPELRKQHERAVELEEDRISILKHDKEQYIKFLFESGGDHEFIVQNIEVKLGNYPYRKSYWKQYIGYLEKSDPKAMLNVYSRYCRFFVNDWKMRESYRIQIKRLNKKGFNVKQYINDYKLLLMDFPISASYTLIFHQLIKNLIASNCISIYRNFKSLKPILKATFQLPKPKSKQIHSNFRGFEPHFLEYLVKNANYKLLYKFYSISRWFYNRRKVPLCHRLCICDTRKTISAEWSLFVTPENLQIEGLKNIYVTNALIVISKDPLALSKMIQKIYKFDPWFIKIEDQILTYDEYCFIMAEGNVRKIWLDNVIVTGTNGEQLPVECLIEKLPNAQAIGFERNTLIKPDTSEKLGYIQLKTKIDRFDLYGVDENFDAQGFSEFIRRNGNSTSKFILHFKREITAHHKLMFKRTLRVIMRTWLPRFTLPQLTIY